MQVLHLNLRTIKNKLGRLHYTSIILGLLKKLHSNLGTVGTIWANWKSFIQICIQDNYKYLDKLQQPQSTLSQFKKPHSNSVELETFHN